MKSSFFDAYKHPKWQLKRLEKIKDANGRCEECGADDVELHVHHGMYVKGKKPWEYSNEMLHCLCTDCHNFTHEMMDILKEILAFLHSSDLCDISVFLSAIMSAKTKKTDDYDDARASMAWDAALQILPVWGDKEVNAAIDVIRSKCIEIYAIRYGGEFDIKNYEQVLSTGSTSV